MRWGLSPAKSLKRRWARPPDRQKLRDFNRSMVLIVDPDSLQASACARISELFGCNRIIVLEPDPEKGTLVPAYSTGFGQDMIKDVAIRRQGPLARWLLVNETCLFVHKAPGVCDYLSESERGTLARLDIRVCVPLMSLNRLIGIMLLGSEKPDWDLSPQDIELLGLLAGQASLAFENAYLYRQQRDRLRRIYQAERLAAAGQLAAGVAHEIRNPLTAIRSTIQYLSQDYPASNPRRALLEELLSEVDRIDRTVDGLLSLTRLGEFVPEPVDIIEVLEHALMLITAHAQRQGVSIGHPASVRHLRVMGNAEQLKQVFLNLLLNALQAMPAGGRIETSVGEYHSMISPAGGRWAQVCIRDSGSGIKVEHTDRIFEPFFTTKRDGTGLGLSVCQGIVHAHEGEIEIRSEEGKGTLVMVRIPML